MFNMDILAQAADTAANTAWQGEALRQQILDFIWEQVNSLSWKHAIIAMSFGLVQILYGWRIFKILVFITFGLIGMVLGIWLGQQLGSKILGGIVGMILIAALSLPLMKWCVSALGALAGGIITGGVWYAFNLNPDYIWAGAAVGVVAGGMMSFIMLKSSVMLFTCMSGSSLIVIGMLALMNTYDHSINNPPNNHVHNLIYNNHWFLIAILILPTLAGIILQNRFLKESSSWDLKDKND